MCAVGERWRWVREKSRLGPTRTHSGFCAAPFPARETGREVMNASSSKSPWPGGVQMAHPGKARGLNSLYSRPQLETVLHRERLRADRNRTEFSLILFRVR